MSFMEASGDLGGAVSIRSKDSKTAIQLEFRIDPIGKGCVGEIDLQTFAASGNSITGTSGNFARWSSTACAVGEDSVSTDAGVAGGPSLAAEATQAWAHATYTGTWDDGASTDLTLAIGKLPPSGCAEGTVLGRTTTQISLPVQITYETGDGSVATHTASATLSTSGSMLSLNSGEKFACATSNSSLPYAAGDCAAISRVELQLSLGFTPGVAGGPDTRSGTLSVYEYGKNAAPNAGMADAVHTLVLDRGR